MHTPEPRRIRTLSPLAERTLAAQEARLQSLPPCQHPPARLYAWTASDGTFCVACCACGDVLKGGES